MANKRCPVCGKLFVPYPQVKHQKFCSFLECQRERKRRWQAAKHQTDPVYKASQKEHARTWAKQHPDYWREYRTANPEYVERNRAQQKIRNIKRRETLIAKMDESNADDAIPSGIYRLTHLNSVGIANKDSWTVEITLISRSIDKSDI